MSTSNARLHFHESSCCHFPEQTQSCFYIHILTKIFLFEQFYIYHVVLDLYNDEDDLGI